MSNCGSNQCKGVLRDQRIRYLTERPNHNILASIRALPHPRFLLFPIFYYSPVSTIPRFLLFPGFYYSPVSTIPWFLLFPGFYYSLVSTIPRFLTRKFQRVEKEAKKQRTVKNQKTKKQKRADLVPNLIGVLICTSRLLVDRVQRLTAGPNSFTRHHKQERVRVIKSYFTNQTFNSPVILLYWWVKFQTTHKNKNRTINKSVSESVVSQSVSQLVNDTVGQSVSQ